MGEMTGYATETGRAVRARFAERLSFGIAEQHWRNARAGIADIAATLGTRSASLAIRSVAMRLCYCCALVGLDPGPSCAGVIEDVIVGLEDPIRQSGVTIDPPAVLGWLRLSGLGKSKNASLSVDETQFSTELAPSSRTAPRQRVLQGFALTGR